MMVLNVVEVVTVTVMTTWRPGQLMASGLRQSLTGAVGLKVPVSFAHWHVLEATAVTPDKPVALVAVVNIVAISPLWAALCPPYWAPARAAFVKFIAV